MLTLQDVHRVANDRVLTYRPIHRKWHGTTSGPVIRVDVVDLCCPFHLAVVAEPAYEKDLALVVATSGPVADIMWHRSESRIPVRADVVAISGAIREEKDM